MTRDIATSAQRSASECSASLCPECDTPPGSPHAIDCPLRPVLRFEEYLANRYARGDAGVFRSAGTFQRYELLEIDQ